MTSAPQLKIVEPSPPSVFEHITPYYDETHDISWVYMHAAPRPCFTQLQLDELKRALAQVRDWKLSGERDVKCNVVASSVDGAYSLGGDLHAFQKMIVARDRAALTHYAYSCIHNIYTVASRFRGAQLPNVSLVQGSALGGGMECALAADLVIAEQSARMGLPEVLFNLFPGMGAYSILSRKIGPAPARRLILSGKVYRAEELYDMGVVDVLAEDGEGELAVYDYVKSLQRAGNTHDAMARVVSCVDPLTYQELEEIADIWVDAALKLARRDLRMMERLVSRQHREFDVKRNPGFLNVADRG